MIAHTPALRPSHRSYPRLFGMGGSAVNNMRETESIPGNAVRWVINLPHILRKFEGGFMGVDAWNLTFATKTDLLISRTEKG